VRVRCKRVYDVFERDRGVGQRSQEGLAWEVADLLLPHLVLGGEGDKDSDRVPKSVKGSVGRGGEVWIGGEHAQALDTVLRRPKEV
jgi:hypothetical protein